MLMPHPLVLRQLLAHYEELRTQVDDEAAPEVHRELLDTIYTLCVSTGTREIEAAVSIAREYLDQSSLGRRHVQPGAAVA